MINEKRISKIEKKLGSRRLAALVGVLAFLLGTGIIIAVGYADNDLNHWYDWVIFGLCGMVFSMYAFDLLLMIVLLLLAGPVTFLRMLSIVLGLKRVNDTNEHENDLGSPRRVALLGVISFLIGTSFILCIGYSDNDLNSWYDWVGYTMCGMVFSVVAIEVLMYIALLLVAGPLLVFRMVRTLLKPGSSKA
jgi:uncharacterized membrane protein